MKSFPNKSIIFLQIEFCIQLLGAGMTIIASSLAGIIGALFVLFFCCNLCIITSSINIIRCYINRNKIFILQRIVHYIAGIIGLSFYFAMPYYFIIKSVDDYEEKAFYDIDGDNISLFLSITLLTWYGVLTLYEIYYSFKIKRAWEDKLLITNNNT